MHEWHDGCQHLPCLIFISSPSWVEVGNGIIELLSCRCEGQILGQAVLLTNSFLVGILTIAIFLLKLFGAGGYRVMLSIAVENLDALYHVAFCRDLHLLVHCVLSGNFWYF